ncbi:ATPase AAA [Desulfosarcina widdelii]|uniref:HTH-type transcriptional regulatory protein TyrR n=1 Tax=Desulfosarcina widdelii TaxID=947919 RepID=A0A5K7Z3P5_9BACT|nr:sigma-54-dependent Fis family transcriptional regulator [Desulfosarcina widdelii]BBO73104.1 ATPase AAA [Desulfosarcina widdelii]
MKNLSSPLSKEILVKDFMTTNPVSLKETDKLKNASKILADNRINSAIVKDLNDKLSGIITVTDILHKVYNFTDPNFFVKDLSIPNVYTIHERDSLDDVIQLCFSSGLNLLPVVDDFGCVVGIWTNTNLVNALRLLTDDLVGSFEAILKSIDYGIIAFNKNKKCVFINNIGQKMLQLNENKVKGLHITDLLQYNNIDEVFDSKKAIKGEKLIVNNRVLYSNLSPIFSNGKVLGAVAILQETESIEQIYKNLDNIKQLNAEYDTLIESSFDGIVFSDGLGKMIRINNAYARITNIKPDQIVGRTVRELLRDGIIDICPTFSQLKLGKPISVVQKVYTGKKMLVTSSPIFDSTGKRITMVVTNCRDLTELNKLKYEVDRINIEKERVIQEVTKLRAEKLASLNVIAQSDEMRRVVEIALQVSQFDSTVIITGESGVGKEVIAHMIHKASHRKKGPFIKINCGAIPEPLIESELFGYEDGAFTGAKKKGKPGVFEMADGGSLLMDEIGELSHRMAVGLLRVLQERSVTRVGGTKSFEVDARVIAATNADIQDLVKEGKFRSDLYYRLNVINIYIPPLRERPEDIELLALKFVEQLNKKYNRKKHIDTSMMDQLLTYKWPGNVRELKNFLERVVVLSTTDLITADVFPERMKNIYIHKSSQYGNNDIDKLETLYERYRSSRKVAKILNCHQSTIIRKLNKYGIMSKFKS